MIRPVFLKKGQYRKATFEGNFNAITELQPASGNPEYTHRIDLIDPITNVKRGMWTNVDDIVFLGEDGTEIEAFVQPAVQTDEERLAEITKRFNVMDKLTDGSVYGIIRSLIISGAAGVGKTYNLEKKLAWAEDQGLVKYDVVKGKISPIGLYMRLWENRGSNSIVVLDDVDVFSDDTTLNVLKAALDTGARRILSWATASSFLEEREIPNQFEFEGAVIFVTNTDIDRELERGSKIAPHLDALVSRSLYVDLCVHSNRDIMLWVNEIVTNTTMLEDRGISSAQAADVLEWMHQNVSGLRNVSLRTAIHIADFVLSDPDNWRDLAEVVMIKPKSRR